MTVEAAHQADQIRRFTLRLAVVTTVLAALPALIGWMSTPGGASYLGYQFSTDDQMVYAAWMRQAMDGQFLFDNRFTTDAQPGLTIHLYFWLLGLPARLLGIGWTETLARLGFTFLSVLLLSRLIGKLQLSVFTHKLALALAIFGGGIGFLVWQVFGVAMNQKTWLTGATAGRLPTDVWQPEGFVFPSMLTTSLFVMSLCLLLGVFLCVLDARESWSKVGWGALLLGLMMNVHSYDILIVGVVLVGLLAASLASKTFHLDWLKRVGVMLLGLLPAALWFLYVYQNDPVFQARASTPTFSPTFPQLFFGYLPLVVLALVGGLQYRSQDAPQVRKGMALFAVLVAGLFALSLSQPAVDRYLVGGLGFAGILVTGIGVILLTSRACPAFNLINSWMVLGLILPYVPALFQRKLLMAYAVPLGILAAMGVAQWVEKRERNARNLSTALAIVLCSGSSMLWFQREIGLIRSDVSRTTVHPVYLGADVLAIVERLNKIQGPKIVVAVPGINASTRDPDVFPSPYMPDLNTILSGLTGAYSYAGHWSETPQYGARRSVLYVPRGAQPSLGLFGTDTPILPKKEMLDLIRGARRDARMFVIAPLPAAFDRLALGDRRDLGSVLIEGPRFSLVEVKP
ncbi:MAG TPA: hypothetical protein PLO61_08375 [Fimbriimonadaceae bacterium]|nr:hypothetical protein [Fimbriimonadaceae bacterium]HRJ33582.1 hypothetical protein [Fimbriimonadaceae bacterium]